MKAQEYKALFYAKELNEVIKSAAELWVLARNSRNVQRSYNGIDQKAKQITPNFVEYTKISATLTRFFIKLDDQTVLVEIKNNSKNQIVSKNLIIPSESTLILTEAPTNLSEIIRIK